MCKVLWQHNMLESSTCVVLYAVLAICCILVQFPILLHTQRLGRAVLTTRLRTAVHGSASWLGYWHSAVVVAGTWCEFNHLKEVVTLLLAVSAACSDSMPIWLCPANMM